MSAERRLENKRMKVAKRMEVSCLETGTNFTGETEDVSDSGIRAYLDRSPKAGANVMVKLFWDDDQNPVETFGRVAWSTPVPIGEGIEVGLMLGAEGDVYGKKEKKKKRTVTRYHKYRPTNASNATQYVPFEAEWSAYDESIENKKTVAAIPQPVQPIVSQESEPVVLVVGESFRVSLRGRETWAKIDTADAIDNKGQIQLTLQIKDKHLWKRVKSDADVAPKAMPADPMDDFDPEQWKAKPISNACHTIKKYIAPPIRIAIKLSMFIFELTAGATYLVWKKIPLPTREKIYDALYRVKGLKAVSYASAVFSFTRNNSSKLIAKFAK